MMAVLKVVGQAFFVMAVGLLFMGFGRRFTARFHRRYGPPVWQSYIDVIKLFSRKSISHHWIMDLGSLMGLAGLTAASIFLPVGKYLAFPSTGPIIVILYLMPIGYLGMAMGVSSSKNPLATIGIARALTLMLGYEVPFAILILCMISSYGSTSLLVIGAAQQADLLHWNMFTMPFGFVASIIALLGMLGEKPFDTMIAPAEIASGPMVELSGKFLGLAFLQHSVAIFIETGLVVILFLGASTSVWSFVLKQFFVYMLAVALNAIWARYRVEQAVKFLWVTAGGLAFVQLLINMYV